ncbi:hypothetical protein [Methanoculleus bourgensis]|uniref:Uncharacterized protein n=1 Tax=Methanoculleus bourgensis TaxID=83986 RepID=A0A0X3BLZ1_9EURY|nr:exported protein of unknown function [Methanoculleus bourgensis]
MTFFDLARRNVSRHWLRSILAVTGIVIGVIAIARWVSSATVSVSCSTIWSPTSAIPSSSPRR